MAGYQDDVLNRLNQRLGTEKAGDISPETGRSIGMPRRQFGNTGETVSIFCMGGWHIAQCAKDQGEAEALWLMEEAVDAGLNFFDNAWDYHDGYAEKLMGKFGNRHKIFLMTKNCSRDYLGSMRCLEESLWRLKTDYLDLWQFHECNYDSDPARIVEEGGLKAAKEALKQGKVRHVGFTGHKHPDIHLGMLNVPFKWASCQMPINVCDYHYRSFQNKVVPVCVERGVAALAMKSLGGGDGIMLQIGVHPEELLRYTLSQPITSLVAGIQNERDLQQALRVGLNFTPMTPEEQNELRWAVQDSARDGRYELFKSTNRFDGEHHLEQHGFPELKLPTHD